MPEYPKVTYFSAMNFLLCLTEDVSYRTEFVDDYLEVLWHPQEDRVVGVKVSHAREVYDETHPDHEPTFEGFVRKALWCSTNGHSVMSYSNLTTYAKYSHAAEMVRGIAIPVDTRQDMREQIQPS